jgi:cytochrome c oxidase assembly protein subunit 15
MVRRLALICAALMLATIVLSAFMRLSQAGLGCADWPACYGQNLSSVAQAPAPGTAVIVARMLHRIVASLVLVLVIMLTLSTLAMRPRLHVEGRLSAVMLLCAGAVSTWRVTAGATLPAVTLGNDRGFLMLALCWRLAVTPAARQPRWHAVRAHAPQRAALALAMLLVRWPWVLVSGLRGAVVPGWADCSKSAAAADGTGRQ